MPEAIFHIQHNNDDEFLHTFNIILQRFSKNRPIITVGEIEIRKTDTNAA